MRWTKASWVFLAIFTVTAAVAFTGCAAFQHRDPTTGQPTGQLDQAKVEAAQASVVAAGSIFGPLGSAIGAAAALIIGAGAAAWQRKVGESKGYDQGSLDAGKPLPSAGAKP